MGDFRPGDTMTDVFIGSFLAPLTPRLTPIQDTFHGSPRRNILNEHARLRQSRLYSQVEPPEDATPAYFMTVPSRQLVRAIQRSTAKMCASAARKKMRRRPHPKEA